MITSTYRRGVFLRFVLSDTRSSIRAWRSREQCREFEVAVTFCQAFADNRANGNYAQVTTRCSCGAQRFDRSWNSPRVTVSLYFPTMSSKAWWYTRKGTEVSVFARRGFATEETRVEEAPFVDGGWKSKKGREKGRTLACERRKKWRLSCSHGCSL